MTARIQVARCRCQICAWPGSVPMWFWHCTGCLAESLGADSPSITADQGRAHLVAMHPVQPRPNPVQAPPGEAAAPTDRRTTPRRTP